MARREWAVVTTVTVFTSYSITTVFSRRIHDLAFRNHGSTKQLCVCVCARFQLLNRPSQELIQFVHRRYSHEQSVVLPTQKTVHGIKAARVSQIISVVSSFSPGLH